MQAPKKIKYVSDPNDPAYKAYSDSLDVYNKQNFFNQQYLQNFEKGEVEPFVPEDDPSFFKKLKQMGQESADASQEMYENFLDADKDNQVIAEYPDRISVNDELRDKTKYSQYDTRVDKGNIILREGHKIKNSEANEQNFADAIFGDDTEDIFEEKVRSQDQGYDVVSTRHKTESEGGMFDDYDTKTWYKYSYPHKEVFHKDIKPAGYHQYHEAHSPNRDADPSSVSYDANQSFDVDLPYYIKPKMKVEVRPEEPEVEFEEPVPSKPGKLPVTEVEVEETPFEKFRKTLPSNLRYTDPNDYDLEGYWDALGRPEEFDYENEPKDPEDGGYHGFSRHPRTGQLLKSENHPSFKKGLEADVEMGYLPYRNKKTGKIHTFDTPPNPNDFEPYGDYHKKENKKVTEPYIKKVLGAPGPTNLFYIDSLGNQKAINQGLLNSKDFKDLKTIEVNYKDMKNKQAKGPKKYKFGFGGIASGFAAKGKALGNATKYGGGLMAQGLGGLSGAANFATDAVNLYAGITGDEKAAKVGKVVNNLAGVSDTFKTLSEDEKLNEFMTDYEKNIADNRNKRAEKRSIPSFKYGRKYPGGVNYKKDKVKTNKAKAETVSPLKQKASKQKMFDPKEPMWDDTTSWAQYRDKTYSDLDSTIAEMRAYLDLPEAEKKAKNTAERIRLKNKVNSIMEGMEGWTPLK